MAGDKYLILLFTFSCLCFVSCELNLSEDSPCVTQGLRGICVNIFKCNSAALTYLYANAGFDPVKYGIPDLPEICSYEDNEPVVCCTDCDTDEEMYRGHYVRPGGVLSPNEEGSIALRKCYEHYGRLPYPCRGMGGITVKKTWNEHLKCHQSSYSYVAAVGGREAQRWEFPHVALIGYGDSVETAQWLCGGSVISERFILTAGHCTSTLLLGNISFAALGLLKRTDPKKYWKIYNIKRIIIHPDYKPPSKYHDIALLETETEINFGRDLLPACLELHADDSWTGFTAEAAGWGRLGHRQALADTLQVVYLKKFSQSECSTIYPRHRLLKNGYDNETQMCYGNHDEIIDTCEGDSGGPLQINDIKCLYTVVAVTSYGKGCGVLGSAGMYTRVSHYVPWIESVVWPEDTEAKRKKDENEPCITKGLNGTCVGIFRCTSASLTYLYANAGYDVRKHDLPELPDICSYKNNEPVVCCTDCDISQEEPFRDHAIGPLGDVTKNDGSVASRKFFEYFGRLPYPCRGGSNILVQKIWEEDLKCHQHTLSVDLDISGQDAKNREFPHVASIGYGDNVETAQWLCGGSVISERFILTAAHCTSTRSLGNISFAALGLMKLTDPKEYWKIYNIKRIIAHPDYKPPSKYHDIALLETETEINFGRNLLPACLDIGTWNSYTAQAPGWGRLDEQALADTLQVVYLDEYNETECSKIYPPDRLLKNGYDHETQMCYGNHDELIDTCEGDSGGPLQTNQFKKCQYSIIGVTSYGKDCGILGSAGMYTRVSHYVPWIESIVWPEETEAGRSEDQLWLDKWLSSGK